MIQSIAANIDKSQNICGRSRLYGRDRADAHVLTAHAISSDFKVCRAHQRVVLAAQEAAMHVLHQHA